MSTGPTNPRCDDGCPELLAKLEAYLDGVLADTDRHDLERHIAACYPCAGRETLERQLRALIQSSCLEAAPATLREQILTRVHEDTSG